MAVSDPDLKLLWGRAAGICSNPQCRADLTVLLEKAKDYNVGEMAHVIAKSEAGPRGIEGGGSDAYSNLILLCPTCHTHIDKSPEGTFTVEQLQAWKQEHEKEIRTGIDIQFDSIAELKQEIAKLLIENHILWEKLGPSSDTALEDPGSNLHKQWDLKKLDTIIPNNNKIIRLIECNSGLIAAEDYRAFLLFKNHASSFEANQYHRLDHYETFPKEFSEAFEA